MTRSGYVYILASRRNGTLHVGVTSDLVRRVHQHRNGLTEGFVSKYGVHRLVYYEVHDRIDDAIRREKAMKKWRRQWKLKLIEAHNPEWLNLYPALTGFPPTRE
jgi:putative endonuclease